MGGLLVYPEYRGGSPPKSRAYLKKREEFGRLLRYVKPYELRLVAGVVCLSMVGLAEGLIALMITPIFDRLLNPGAPDSRLFLITNPLTHKAGYLNSFLPRTHRVCTMC